MAGKTTVSYFSGWSDRRIRLTPAPEEAEQVIAEVKRWSKNPALAVKSVRVNGKAVRD